MERGRKIIFFGPLSSLFQSMLVDDDSAEKLKIALLETNLLTSIPYVIMALGVICGIVFVAFACRPFWPKEEVSSCQKTIFPFRSNVPLAFQKIILFFSLLKFALGLILCCQFLLLSSKHFSCSSLFYLCFCSVSSPFLVFASFWNVRSRLEV